MSIDAVAFQIETAFADTPSPGIEFEAISATNWDEGIVDYFRGKDWRGHRVEDLRHYDAALSFFTDKAFRFWLPAFMLAELETPDEADVIAEGIAFHLTGSRAECRLAEFAQDELEAIAAFLKECEQRRDTICFREAEQMIRSRIQKA